MGKKKKGPVIKKGLDEWMATYSDMVTLLLCFFVLLYSSSTQDKTKIQYIFQAFNTGGNYLNTLIGKDPETPKEGDGDTNSDIPPIIEEDSGTGSDVPRGDGTDPDSFNELYTSLQMAIDSSSVSDKVSLDGNDGQIRICLADDVLFVPDSYELTSGGRKALSLLTPSIKATEKFIESVIIQGHTAKVTGASLVNDWDLSSLRASQVTKYFDFTKTVGTEKLKAEGLGSNVPIDDADTPEAKAKNRRVEIIINRKKELAKNDLFLSIMEFDYNQHFFEVDANGNRIDNNFLNSDDVIQSIADAIDSRYGEKQSSDSLASQTPVGPTPDDMLSIPESDYVSEIDAALQENTAEGSTAANTTGEEAASVDSADETG